MLVFIVLAEVGRPVDRERLMEVFWPGPDAKRGRAALRQSLAYLRSGLPDGALVRRGNRAVGIDSEKVGCDALRFGELLEAGRTADALELYRGDLLDGFVTDAGEAFDGWLAERREAFRVQAAEAAWGLAEKARSDDRRAEAAFWGKRALGLSPFEEPEVQRLIKLLAAIGDRAGVFRVYRGLEERLEEEGARPSPLTSRIVEEVRKLDPQEGVQGIDGGGGRRSGVDRRSGEDRRRPNGVDYGGPERRSGAERRGGVERRSGTDRRLGG